VTAEVDGERSTERDILGFFQLLLVAGTETTTNLGRRLGVARSSWSGFSIKDRIATSAAGDRLGEP
jgi:hypothetical protein